MLKRALPSVGLILCTCSTLSVQSPSADKRLVLAAPSSQCKTESTQAQWYLLFGAVPLGTAKLAFADPARTYRVTEERTWLDKTITIIGGSLLTVTRKTMRVESCEEQFAVVSPDQLEDQKKKEIQTVLDSLLAADAPGMPGEPAFLMKSGEVRRGKIQEISAEEIVILERRQSQAAPEPAPDKSGKIARIMLMDGTQLAGEITNQTPTVITLSTRRGTLTIQKSNVRRISYQESPAEKEARKKQEEESAGGERVTL